MDFNLQDFLRDMREEQRDGFHTITDRAERLADELTKHTKDDAVIAERLDGRLKNIEDVKSTMRWFVGALVLGAIGVSFDALVNHLHLLK